MTFGNLSGDAELVVPTPMPKLDYPHLSAFVRSAPSEQQRALWAAVGLALTAWWLRTSEPVWTSTSGLGVSWLHIRLDQRPKYYTHAPFRRWSGSADGR